MALSCEMQNGVYALAHEDEVEQISRAYVPFDYLDILVMLNVF